MTPEQFWARLDRSGPDVRGLGPCWEWRNAAGKRPTRYGWVRLGTHEGMPHRVAYALAVGRVPEGLNVLHACDNPGCCNPSHLSVGTQQENRRQAAERGRTDRHLSELDALDVLVSAARGESQRSIADRLGVARNTVVCILSGQSFFHVRQAVGRWVISEPPLAMTGTEG